VAFDQARAGGPSGVHRISFWARLRNTFLRVWLIVLIGIIATGALTYRTARAPGVFWGQVNVVFVAPVSTLFPNSILTGSESLTITAGVVAKLVGSSVDGGHVASDSVTLYGEGIRHGYSVALPNSGGQYANNFDQPLLDVQAVGADAYEVISTMNRVVADIQATLAQVQKTANSDPSSFIRASPNPSTPQLYYVAGSRIRAVAASVILGLGITVTLAMAVSRADWRRKRRPGDDVEFGPGDGPTGGAGSGAAGPSVDGSPPGRELVPA
jgi:hypothetical protein